MEKTKVVLVTGIGGNVGQGVLRNIRDIDKNIKIIGTDITKFTPGNYLCDKTYTTPYAYEQSFIENIASIVTKESINLIIPTTDYEMYYLSLNKSKIKCTIAGSDADITKIYLDKYQSYLYHKKHEIPFVLSWLPNDFPEDYTQEIIAKPREGRGSRGILLNPNEPKKLPDNYMIQPLLKGIEITTAVYVNKDNIIHGIFTLERELSNGTTTKSKTIFDFDEQMYNIAQKMVALGGLRGSFNIQSIVDENGNILPFEVNCRISGTNSIRHNLGFQDVKYTIQEYLFDEKPDKPSPIHGVATRILLDVIYPNCIDEQATINSKSPFTIY